MSNSPLINVIILPDAERESECLISSGLDILRSCKNDIEKEALLKMIVQDSREITLREILIKDIQSKAIILEETKKY